MEEIDEFASRPKEEAVTQLKNQGFITETLWINDDSIPYNYVVRTDPPARTRVEIGTVVTIYVSQGASPKFTIVPDFKNLAEATARENAERNDLIPLFEYIPSEDGSVPKGRVISQSIEPNERVDKNTVVTIYVSNGESVEKTTSLVFDINSSATGEFRFTYYVDGTLKQDLAEIKDISLTKEIVWEISGKGIHNYAIVVESMKTGLRKTLIEVEVNFDTDPIEKNPTTFNENVFKELMAEGTTTTEATAPPEESTTPETEPPLVFETEETETTTLAAIEAL